jgi:hypothetical protein
MPDPITIKRAREDAREGKAAFTQAGEFVREEFHHIREGKRGARSAKQAIAIGLSQARRAGVELPSPTEGRASIKVRRHAERDYILGHDGNQPVSARRSRATVASLKREGPKAATSREISLQARTAANQRTPADRSQAARNAVTTKGRKRLPEADRKGITSRMVLI